MFKSEGLEQSLLLKLLSDDVEFRQWTIYSFAVCTDTLVPAALVQPPGAYTCAQLQSWGVCPQLASYAGNFCAASCGRCQGAATL